LATELSANKSEDLTIKNLLNIIHNSSMADIQAISVKDLPVESKPLFVPPLEEIAKCKKPYLIITTISVNI
jgi:hypothetical protein